MPNVALHDRLIRSGCIALAMLGATLTAPAAVASDPVSSALSQVSARYQDPQQRINDVIWLSTMSERLEARVPDPFYRIRLLQTVLDESRFAGVDPQLVLAVIDVESSFRRNAVSNAGALGMMQVMPFWKAVYARPDDDLFNPIVNIRYGCNILRHYMDRYDNVRNALAAYNGSLGRAIYPDKVIARYRRYWQYALNSNSLSLAANTQAASLPSDAIGALILPADQAMLADRPAPIVIEQDEKTAFAQLGISGQ